MDVIFAPDFTDTNPYQRELADALGDRGVSVRFADVEGVFTPFRAVATHGRPDVFHIHWMHAFSVGRSRPVTLLKSLLVLGQLLVLRAAGVRLVWTIHNLTHHDVGHVRLEAAFRHVVVRLCHRVICHCRPAGESVLSAYRLPNRFQHRIAIVPHGHYVDSYPNDVAPAEAADRLDVSGDPTFLTFGQIRRYKRVPELLETFRELESPEAAMIVAGSPKTERLREDVERAAAGDDRIRADLRFVPRDEVQLFMNAADVVVLPFTDVLSSGSLLLAMSFGKAVVAPDVGCVESVLPDEGGFTYDGDDPGGLRRALTAATTGDLEAMGAVNRRAALCYDWNSIARDTLRVYTPRPQPREAPVESLAS